MTAESYCTVTDVRNYLGLESGDNMGPSDSVITGFISNASRTIDAYALRQFSGTENKVEWFDTAYGLQHLTLSARPVNSLTSVETADSSGNLSALTIGRIRGTDSCFLSDQEAGIIQFFSPFSETLQQRIKVTYSTGRALADIPAEVKQATILLAARAAIRATLIDENCSDRVKELWTPLLAATGQEYKEMLELVKRHRSLDVAVFGEHQPSSGAWRHY